MEFTLQPKRVAQLMLTIILILATLHIAQLVAYFMIDDSDTFDFIKMLDFDYEANLPSFYSSTAIIFCAALLWIIGVNKRRNGEDFRYHWLGLAGIFTFLGIDEAIALHEEIGDFVEAQQWVEPTGFLYFAWVVPYGILLTVFLLSYLKFVFYLPTKSKYLFISAGTLFVTGAVGIEVFSAEEAHLYGTETIYYSTLYTIEELCEMLGIALFAYALLDYIESSGKSVTFNIRTQNSH